MNMKNFFLLIFFTFLLLTQNANSEIEYQIYAKKVTYKKDQNLIIGEGDALAKNNSGYTINSDKIEYDKNNNIIKTFGNSKYKDSKNILTAENFEYDLKSRTIYANNNVVLTDFKGNKFFFKELKFYEKKEEGFAKNISTKFSDNSSLVAETGVLNNKSELATLYNAKFTTCKNTLNAKQEYCPPWTLNSKKIVHDKKNNNIIHYNSIFKLKNIPIFYSPYFSHPDPTVKRRSGLLPPVLTNLTSVGQTIKTPYFFVLSEDSDLTVSPVFYNDEHHLIMTSYRKVFKNAYLQLENGYTKGYKNLTKERTPGSRNFLFLNYNQNTKNFLGNSDLKIKLERVSQQNFLRVNKINTELFREDIFSLENSFELNTYGANKSFGIKTSVLENLNDPTKNKYTYIYPETNFNYINKFGKFNFNTNSNFKNTKYLTDKEEIKLTNHFDITSDQYINKNFGFGSIFKSSIINNNTRYKTPSVNDNINTKNTVTFALDNSIPFAKISKNSQQFIVPRLFAKYTTGHMRDIKDQNKVLDYADVYSLNRSNDSNNPETGVSFGHGIDYTFKKSNQKNNYFQTKLGIGQVFRTSRLDNMPTQSSLNNNSSDYVGTISILSSAPSSRNKQKNIDNFDVNSIFNNSTSIKYNFNVDNNFSKLLRSDLSLENTFNSFKTKLKFEENSYHIGNTRYAELGFTKYFKNNYYISYNAKKNLKTDSFENKNFGINYENDCLKISLLSIEDFYQDQDLKSSKKIALTFTLKPFSNDFSPDISGLFK